MTTGFGTCGVEHEIVTPDKFLIEFDQLLEREARDVCHVLHCAIGCCGGERYAVARTSSLSACELGYQFGQLDSVRGVYAEYPL